MTSSLPRGVRRPTGPCPCGSGAAYGACCGPLHVQRVLAGTAEQLMRSRYAAYAVGDLDHVFRTWHPRTRPGDPAGSDLAWTGLEVLATEAGGVDDDTGVVEFRAHHRGPDGREAVLHERSRFARRGGRWVYVDGDLLP